MSDSLYHDCPRLITVISTGGYLDPDQAVDKSSPSRENSDAWYFLILHIIAAVFPAIIEEKLQPSLVWLYDVKQGVVKEVFQ